MRVRQGRFSFLLERTNFLLTFIREGRRHEYFRVTKILPVFLSFSKHTLYLVQCTNLKQNTIIMLFFLSNINPEKNRFLSICFP